MIVKRWDEVGFDSKGRLRLGKKERERFGERLVIVRFRDCLFFLTEKEWDKLIIRRVLPLKGIVLRRTRRFICSSAFWGKIDEQGRALVPIFQRKQGRENRQKAV